MKWVFAIGYIDDIVYSDTWVDHLAHLRRPCEALRKAMLELHPGKCAFGAQEVKYLGHLVTRDGIRACPSKIKAIAEMPRSASAKEVQRFIGKCQYYRKLIPNFSQAAAPLFKTQNARRYFVWTGACYLAWTRPKEALVSDAILVHPRLYAGLPIGLRRVRGGFVCRPPASVRRRGEGGCLRIAITAGAGDELDSN